MQRSRRAILRRKAAQELRAGVDATAGRWRRLYGFSASLLVVALILLISHVRHGDGQRGISNCPRLLIVLPIFFLFSPS
jgi:hypothetical protein